MARVAHPLRDEQQPGGQRAPAAYLLEVQRHQKQRAEQGDAREELRQGRRGQLPVLQ
jgi:hypothetical protein